ncbi:patatin-like phospholipase family protein [Vibrio palustris]|uniref:NTE family protein RssA n=1 Tax=Vibrio palustris TaxID=1918946 RepID=A0A1R4B8T7_9VIBR|nr:NTE family protein RssA [Vibrio palustris]
MKRWYSLWTIILVIVPTLTAHAKEAVTPQSNDNRPKIAVVLAGGGAKGAAHVGVLKALEDLHVPVDMITGTSMGAYVAGLYATGMSGGEIEGLVNHIDWYKGYRDRVSREQRRVRDKEYEDRYQLTTDLGVSWNDIRAPKGVVQGQNMLRILRYSTHNLLPLASFDDLVIPYRAVATDIIKLKPFVLDHGYLADAMMASMSVPGALPPYKLDDHWLVDGGVTNNMPVDVARSMGADRIIAVDISTDYMNQDSFTGFLSIADQLSNYLVRRSTQLQQQKLTDKDILLQPAVGDMETTAFDKIPEAFKKGYQAVMEQKESFAPYELSAAKYREYLQKKAHKRSQLKYGDAHQVDRITLDNQSHYSDKLLLNRLDLEAGQVIPTPKIEESVENLYVLDRFERVSYHFDDSKGDNNLIIKVEEKSWGPNYTNFRVFMEDDFDSDSQYSLGMSVNFTDMNDRGAELTLNVNMGTDKLLEAQYYSPIFEGQKLFYTASAKYSVDKRNAPLTGFDDTSLEATKNYMSMKYSEWQEELAIGYQHRLWREFKLGLRFNQGKTEYATLPQYGNARFRRSGAFFNYRIDTLDSYALPSQGAYLNLEYLISHDDIYNADRGFVENSSDTVSELSAKLIYAHSFDRHTLVANVDYGEVRSKNTSTPIDPKTIGGFLNLSGVPRNSLIGQNKAFTSVTYRYRWFDNDFGLFTSPVYLGASLEYGGVWSNPDEDLSSAPLYAAGSVFAGVDSPIGPIMFGYGRTEQNFDSIYLIIGSSTK